ncbi:MAG: hypothetical protein C5B55_13945 [Blastocatellia bacterium]|nr:MAG: hypothetical protein C5B55_13945 [Blastocatellia bacterium]
MKRKSGVTFDDVRRIVATLPDSVESTSYGTPAFKVRGALFVRLRDDIDALVVRVEMDRRHEMLEADPETYFITDHYLEYPWILVRMSVVKVEALTDLLRGAWELARASKQSTKSNKSKGRTSKR